MLGKRKEEEKKEKKLYISFLWGVYECELNKKMILECVFFISDILFFMKRL